MNLSQDSFRSFGLSCARLFQVGFLGVFFSFMPASSGVRLAFLLLHSMQASTQFSQVEAPPRDFGMTWSIVNSSGPGCTPQYWQGYLSRLKKFFRLKTTDRRPMAAELVSTITSGGTRDRRWLRITSPSSFCLALLTSFHVTRSTAEKSAGSMIRAEPLATRPIASFTDIVVRATQRWFSTRTGLFRIFSAVAAAVILSSYPTGPESKEGQK